MRNYLHPAAQNVSVLIFSFQESKITGGLAHKHRRGVSFDQERLQRQAALHLIELDDALWSMTAFE